MNIDFYNNSINLSTNYLDRSHILIAGEFKRGKNIELIFDQTQFNQIYGIHNDLDYLLCRDIILPQVDRISILRAINPFITDIKYGDMLNDINYTTSSFCVSKIKDSSDKEIEHIITLDSKPIVQNSTTDLNTFINNNILINNSYKNDNLYDLLLFKQDLTMILNQKNIDLNKYLIFDSNYNHINMRDYYLYSSNTESINDEHSIYFKQYRTEYDDLLDLNNTCQVQYLQRNSLTATDGANDVDAKDIIGISGLTGLNNNHTYSLKIIKGFSKSVVILTDITDVSNSNGLTIFSDGNVSSTSNFIQLSNSYVSGYIYFDFSSTVTNLTLIFTVNLYEWNIIDTRIQEIVSDTTELYTNNLISSDLETGIKFSSNNFYGQCYWLQDPLDRDFRLRWLTQVQNKTDNILLMTAITPGDWGNNIQVEIKGSNIVDDFDKRQISDSILDEQILILIYYDDKLVEYFIIDKIYDVNDITSNYALFCYYQYSEIDNSNIYYKFNLLDGKDGIITKQNYIDVYKYYMNEDYSIILLNNRFNSNIEIYNEIIDKKIQSDLHCTILIQKDNSVDETTFRMSLNSDDDVFIFTDEIIHEVYNYPRYFLLIGLMSSILNNQFTHIKFQKHVGGFIHLSNNNSDDELEKNNINYFDIDYLMTDINMNNTDIVLASSILVNKMYNDLKSIVDSGIFNNNVNVLKLITNYINRLSGFEFITVEYDANEDVYVIEYRLISGIRVITMKFYRS